MNAHNRFFRTALLASLFFTTLFNFHLAIAQSSNLNAALSQYFNDLRNGTSPSITSMDSALLQQEAFSILLTYTNDSSAAVVSKAYELISRVTSGSLNPALRRKGTEILTGACNRTDPSLSDLGADLLRQYRREDFTPAALNTLRALIKSGSPSLDKLMKIAGYLELKDLIPAIRSYNTPGQSPAQRWSALVSLARMGDVPAVRDMMTRVKRLPVNDEVVYGIFPDLLYTRQRAAVDWVANALMRDEANCFSADAERETSIPCGYRIMEQLAPVIQDFPFRLTEAGDLETGDYRQALMVVREWFRGTQDYIILNDTY